MSVGEPMHEEVVAALRERFPDEIEDQPEGIDTTVVVSGHRLPEVARFLRQEAGFDYLSDLAGVDHPERFEVVYHLYSTSGPAPPLVLKVLLEDKEDPRVPSVTGVWEGANFQEREAYDLMGIVFEGHPNLERILLWDGFPGHPLRKDFANRTCSFEEMELTLPPEDHR